MSAEDINEELVVSLVFDLCQKRPAALPRIIQTATSGVQQFAQNQQDKTGKMAIMLCDRISGIGTFSDEDVFKMIEPWFEGTEWAKKSKQKGQQ